MIKEELWKRWADPRRWYEYTEQEYPLSEEKKDFFADLEAWYADRHVRELNAIKKELMKSLDEMNEAFSDAAKNEVEMRGGCTAIAPGEDCLSSELCEYCTYPPDRFSKGVCND